MTDVTQPEVWWSQGGAGDNTTVFKVTVTDSQNRSAQDQVTIHFNPGGGIGGGGGAPGTLAVVVSPNPCVGHYDPKTGGTVTEHAFATVSNGVAPFKFHWAYVSGFTNYGMTDPTQPEVWWFRRSATATTLRCLK